MLILRVGFSIAINSREMRPADTKTSLNRLILRMHVNL